MHKRELRLTRNQQQIIIKILSQCRTNHLCKISQNRIIIQLLNKVKEEINWNCKRYQALKMERILEEKHLRIKATMS